MAPLPKRRHSSRRQAQRSRALSTSRVTIVTCAQCGKLKEPHKVCKSCGFYEGKPVIVKKAKVKQKSRQ